MARELHKCTGVSNEHGTINNGSRTAHGCIGAANGISAIRRETIPMHQSRRAGSHINNNTASETLEGGANGGSAGADGGHFAILIHASNRRITAAPSGDPAAY